MILCSVEACLAAVVDPTSSNPKLVFHFLLGVNWIMHTSIYIHLLPLLLAVVGLRTEHLKMQKV
jgi:hypothetical protein